MKNINLNLPIFSLIFGIIIIFLDIVLYIMSNQSGRLIFIPLFVFFDYVSFVSLFFTWFFVVVGLIAGIKGLKDPKRKIAKWGIGLSVGGFVIYILLVLSLYVRAGML